jgi:hypothetical protein
LCRSASIDEYLASDVECFQGSDGVVEVDECAIERPRQRANDVGDRQACSRQPNVNRPPATNAFTTTFSSTPATVTLLTPGFCRSGSNSRHIDRSTPGQQVDDIFKRWHLK